MAGDRTYSARYALDNPAGVRQLLGEYNAIVDRQYNGDYDAIIIRMDLDEAIRRADLTDRQQAVIQLVFFDDYTQKEAGVALGLAQYNISRTINSALAKIAAVYESWAWRDEGYSITKKHRVVNSIKTTVARYGHSYVKIKHGKWRTIL